MPLGGCVSSSRVCSRRGHANARRSRSRSGTAPQRGGRPLEHVGVRVRVRGLLHGQPEGGGQQRPLLERDRGLRARDARASASARYSSRCMSRSSRRASSHSTASTGRDTSHIRTPASEPPGRGRVVSSPLSSRGGCSASARRPMPSTASRPADRGGRRRCDHGPSRARSAQRAPADRARRENGRPSSSTRRRRSPTTAQAAFQDASTTTRSAAGGRAPAPRPPRARAAPACGPGRAGGRRRPLSRGRRGRISQPMPIIVAPSRSERTFGNSSTIPAIFATGDEGPPTPRRRRRRPRMP